MEIRSTSFFKIVDIFYTDPTRPPDTDSDSDKGEVTEVNSASSLDLKCECALSAFVFFFPRFRFFLLGQVIGISGSSGGCQWVFRGLQCPRQARLQGIFRQEEYRRAQAPTSRQAYVPHWPERVNSHETRRPHGALQSRQQDRWFLDSPTSITKICLASTGSSRQISIRNLPRNQLYQLCLLRNPSM